MDDKPQQSRPDGDDAAHDVLAAEEFPLGSPDPALKPDPAHDVLAAEEFPVGTPDPALHRSAFEPPADPSGIEEPHDVLAADEFAVPAGPIDSSGTSTVAKGGLAAAGAAVLAAAVGAVAVLRRRRSRSRLDRLRGLRR